MINLNFDKWYWLNEQSIKFLRNGYINEKDDIKLHFRKIGEKVEKMRNIKGFADKFEDYVSRGWYLLPTPGITNFLHEKECPISCFGSFAGDSVKNLLFTDAEIGMLSKIGGGTSVDLSTIRKEGSSISGGGFADGIMKYIKRLQDTTSWISQRSRRGKCATYLDVRHPDIKKYLTIKDRTSEIQEIPFGVKIDDKWIEELKKGDSEKRIIWAEIIKKKFESGFPYIMYTGNINNNKPDIYKDLDMNINNSNLCTEILLSNDNSTTFVCCISAMNLVHFDDWKNTDAIETLLLLLDCFLEDFINKSKDNPLLKRAVKFAEEQLAVGIGASGYHSYLQKNMIPFESMEAKTINSKIFKIIQKQSLEASIRMAEKYGQAPILKNTKYKRRHVTLNAIAPNTSSSEIVGQWSQSIEPIYSNYYIKALAKNKYAQKNKFLEILLDSKNKNTNEVWNSIKNNNGSVQHLDFLSEKEKFVFKTQEEISPMEIIIQNSVRQKFIDQGISLNIMIPFNTPAKDVSQLYLKAHELGIKTLYYQFNQNAAQKFTRDSILECETCAG